MQLDSKMYSATETQFHREIYNYFRKLDLLGVS